MPITIVITVAIIIIGVAILAHYKNKKPCAETVCGGCSGHNCVTGCDKLEEIDEPEKDRIITEDDIRHTAYILASNDNFSKSPETYWIQAEKQLRSGK